MFLQAFLVPPWFGPSGKMHIPAILLLGTTLTMVPSLGYSVFVLNSQFEFVALNVEVHLPSSIRIQVNATAWLDRILQ